MAYKKLKYWFDKELAILLADKILEQDPTFNKKKYVSFVHDLVPDLELKDRVEVLCDGFCEYLGDDYKSNISLLMKILGPENLEETGMFTEYYWVMPIAKYVEKYGLDNLTLSYKALAEVTKRNTSEYAIRPYIIHHQDKTMEKMVKWSKSKNFHLRRLASEGGRPRLPWAPKLDVFIENPKPLLGILDQLKDDPIKFVQKSVANCINDILKDNPEIGIGLIEEWLPNAGKERKWIIKHSLRSLKKKEDPKALSIIEKC